MSTEPVAQSAHPSSAWRYALLGALLGIGSPLGMLALRLYLVPPTGFGGWLQQELDALGWAYLYTGAGTITVFSLMGYFLGHRLDFLGGRLEGLARAADEFRRLSVTDGLTGFYVRRHLMRRLDEEIQRARRYHAPLACLFIDVDDLKLVNDRFGHLFGDEVLVAVGHAVGGALRGTDVVGRYGGDEFVAILPQTDARQAYAVAERIRGDVRALTLEHRGEHAPVTVSIGAYAPLSPPATPTLFLQMADDALRRSKREGKNRTTINPVRSFPFDAAPPAEAGEAS